MSKYSILDEAVQLGARVVDLDTGELFSRAGREEARKMSFDPPSTTLQKAALLQGLSTAHIPTVNLEPEPEPAKPPKKSAVIGWAGASLLKAQKAGPYNLPQVGGGVRGKIQGYTQGSRRRLQKLMATVQKANLPVFATMTYPDSFPVDLETWNTHLERLRSRLKRRGWGCIWRREFKIRLSGQNQGKTAPHYHLLIWGATFEEIRAYLPQAWYECCGRICEEHLAAGTRVEILRTWGGVAGYVSKYMAKVEDLPTMADVEKIGRFWGIINRDAIPWAEAIEITVSDKVVNTFFRYMRRFSHMQARSTWPSMSIYVDDPWKWLEAASQHEGGGKE